MFKFLRISSVYPKFLSNLLRDNKFDKSGDYENTKNFFFDERYGESNNISEQLKKRGYICNEVISNINFLQKKWKSEYGNKNSKDSILIQQIKFYKPDVVYIGNASLATKEFIRKIKELEFVKLILAFHCSPMNYSIKKNLSLVDGIVTCTEGYRNEIYNTINKNILVMKHAFSPNSEDKISLNKRDIDISFFGSIFLGTKLHLRRVNIIYKTMKHFPNSYIAINFSNKFIFQYFFLLARSILNISILKNYDLFYKLLYVFLFSKKPVFGEKMFNILKRSKILINTHIEDTEYAGNMRLFEGTGLGCLLLTDQKKGLSDLFDINREIITFTDENNLINLCNYYLKNKLELEEIANNGKLKTIKSHTYESRVSLLDQFIKSKVINNYEKNL